MGDIGEPRKPRIAIIGAGLTGLLTAHGLQKNGFEVAVFERDADIDVRSRDWTILIHWAMPILARLLPEDVFNNFPKAICNPHLEFNEEVESLPCFNGLTGEILFKNATPGARRITRQGLRKVLAEGFEVRWGKKLDQLSSAEDSIQLKFEDGETYVADYVVGADGVSSTLRQLLLGPEAARPALSGFMFATGVVNYGDAEKTDFIVKAHPVTAIMMGTEAVGACGVMYVQDPKDTSTWTTFWVKIWKGTSVNLQGQEAVRYVRENTSNLCEPFQSAIDWTPEDAQCNIDEMKYWVPVPWDNHSGRVTLLGDASHPMLPFRGQGLQHALTDASNYVDVMLQLRDSPDAGPREKVMTAFDAEMVERGVKAVKQSLQEAEYSLDVETVGKMLMVTHGHGRSA